MKNVLKISTTIKDVKNEIYGFLRIFGEIESVFPENKGLMQYCICWGFLLQHNLGENEREWPMIFQMISQEIRELVHGHRVMSHYQRIRHIGTTIVIGRMARDRKSVV